MKTYKSKNEDAIITVVPFGKYDMLPNEVVLISEDAYGDRAVKIVKEEELVEILKNWTLISEYVKKD